MQRTMLKLKTVISKTFKIFYLQFNEPLNSNHKHTARRYFTGRLFKNFNCAIKLAIYIRSYREQSRQPSRSGVDLIGDIRNKWLNWEECSV